MGAFDDYPLTQDPAVVAAAPPRAPASPFDDIAPLQMAPAAGPRAASGIVESIQAGFQGSAPGLAWRGKLPDLILDPEHAKWWERAAAGITQVGAELPLMAVGGAAGAPVGAAIGGAVTGPAAPAGAAVGSLLGAGAGMFAVPAAIRESLIQAYKSGEIKTAGEFWGILREVAATTAKEGAIGAATFGAGGVAARVAGKAIAPSIGTALSVPTAVKAIGAADTAAQIATMVTMPAALQGRLPDAQEFLDAAIVIGGLHLAAPMAARITSVFEKTGRTPAEQVADVQAGAVKPADYVAPEPGVSRETPALAARATEAAAARLAELSTKAETTPLTDAERAERVFLANAKPDALAKHFDLTVEKPTRAEIDASADRVREDVLRQLREVDDARKATGQTPLGDDHAQAVAALQARQVSYIARQMGVLPEAIYNERALKIRDEAQAEAAASEAPAGAQMFTPPEVDLFGNPVEVTNAPRFAVEGLATVETPLDGLILSKEVPQFKKDANEKGVVIPLGGKFDRTGVGPIQVWERLDGTREIISGRHRWDLAVRSGETTIPAQIHREADGFTAKQAAVLDAMLNIREEQGSIADYVQYFKDSGVTKEAAELDGLLARAKGRSAFAIARDASPDLAAAHRAGLLSDDAALSISAAAPGSERLQALGVAMVNDGKSALMAVNTMKAVEIMAADRIAEGKQGDIFGFDDSAMREAQAMAKKAGSIQMKIREQIAAVNGASKRPALAKQMGVDVADPEGIQKRIVELRQEQYLWDNWPLHPELVARLRAPEITGRENDLNQGAIVPWFDQIKEPPINDGMTRLYRGGNGKGKWFSSSRETADFFFTNARGKSNLDYIDVPTKDAEQYAIEAGNTGQDARGEGAHIVPANVASTAKQLAAYDAKTGRITGREGELNQARKVNYKNLTPDEAEKLSLAELDQAVEYYVAHADTDARGSGYRSDAAEMLDFLENLQITRREGDLNQPPIDELFKKLKDQKPAIDAANSAIETMVEKQRALEGLRAAIRDPETGKIYVGGTHQSAINSAPRWTHGKDFNDPEFAIWGRLSGEWDRGTDNTGFVDPSGTFISRSEAEKRWQISTMEDRRDALNKGRRLYQEPFDLKPETPAELKARDEEAAAAAKRKLAQEKLAEKLGKKTIDQADLFNEQKTLFQSKEPFYSELARQIEGLKQPSASAAQWKGTIKNLKGVKADEIEASGINDWLDAQGGKVTKDQVSQFLAGNGVKVTEVTLGDKSASDALQAKREEMSRALQEDLLKFQDSGYLARDVNSEILAELPQEYQDLYKNIAQQRRAIDGVLMDAQEAFNNAPDPKYSQYQLPGGKNYRELLLTLPEVRGQKKFDESKVTIERNRQSVTQGTYRMLYDGKPMGGWYQDRLVVSNGYKGYSDAEIMDTARTLFENGNVHDNDLKPQTGAFRSSHFDQPNILAHIRFNERTDASGARVLFLEEIQSDWAQKGKKEGFQSDAEQYILAVRKELAAKDAELTAREKELPPFVNGVRAADPLLRALTGEREDIAGRLRALERKEFGVPSAPFVTNTEAWTALALKRMIRYAAENGFDKIAWTRGEQQVERYTSALRKAVDVIEWKKTDKGVQLAGYKKTTVLDANDLRRFKTLDDMRGRGELPADLEREYQTLQTRRGSKGNKVVDTTQQENELSDAIGKAMADRIIKDPSESGTIEGDGIHIDSTGMAGFYDRILPNVANKVLKKLGGGKTGEVGIDTKDTIGDVNEGSIAVVRPNGEVIALTDYDSQAWEIAREHPGARVVPIEDVKRAPASKQMGFEITPEVKAKALEGQPLFQQNQDVHRGSYDIAENLIKTMQGSDKSTVVHELGHSWLEDFKLYAAKPNAPESLKNDWGILRRELGIGEDGEISRASHEQWARTVERYLAEGEAPAPELAGVFSRFREWLLAIYSDLKNLNATVNPELKALLDKMLAGDRDIADAKELNVPPAYVEMARANEAAKIVPSEKPGFKDEQLAMEPFAEELLMGPGSGKGNDSRINAQFINGPLELKLAIQRVSEIDQQGIQKARGGVEGTKSWADANAEVDRLANDVMGGKMVLDATPAGMPAIPHDIQQRAAFRVMTAIAKYSLQLRDNILAKGPDATVQEQFDYLSSIVRMRMAHAEFLGLRAASARALNQIKDMTPESGVVDRMVEMTGGRLFQDAKTDAEVAAELKIKLDKIMAEHFSGKSALDIAKLSKDIKSLKGQLGLAKEVTDTTVWDGVIEGWKAGLLSGPQTPVTNVIGTWSFQALRAPIDAVSAIIGMARGASPGMGESDRASMSEAIARITGSLGGIKDGLKLAYHELERDDPTEKVEAYKTAIPGRAGEIIRFPFRLMSAGDMLTTTMYKRGELKTLAIRQAFDENLNPQTREFAERVQAIIDNPPPKLLAMAEEAANRMAFNQPGGEKIAATQTFIRNWKLEWMVPFIRTPANIAAELLRMTPLAPVVMDWRADIRKGGVARDKAIAEVVVGSGIMALTMAYAFDGTISGSGSPDPGKNRGKAGVWQPNSVLVGDTWYEIGRLQPGGTLMVLAADVANAWDHMTDEERDKVPKILAMAFANAITNQTFLQGITNVVNMMSEPDRYGKRFLEGLAGSTVPNIIGQPTAMADPYVREVNSMLEAIQARIPGLREQLLPKRDWLGEQVQTKERMGLVMPVREQKISEDKVRIEAARLDISMAAAPKKTHIGKGTGKIGDVELTPEERDRFEKVSGEMAHTILSGIVHQPGYDQMPDIIKRNVFSKVLQASHQVGAVSALPMDKRTAYLQSISEKMAAALEPNQ